MHSASSNSAETSEEPASQTGARDAAVLSQIIVDRLDDDKADNIVEIDLMGKSSIADTMIIASGRSARHVSALADHILRTLKEIGYGKVRVEGMQNCDWVLIDAGDVVLHLFRPEVRDFYNLERIWGADAPAVDHLAS